MAGLKASIEQFGIVDPFVVNPKLKIIGGHQRCRAAIELGYKKVPVVYVNLSPEEEKALNVTLNNKHIAGEWTVDLAELLVEIKTDIPELYDSLQLGLLEFDVPEYDFGDEGQDGVADEVPEVEGEPIIKTGDLITLGRHRLLCGDCTVAENVERLMQGEKADMVFTDPPYNIGYKGYTEEKLTIQNDNMTDEEFIEFLNAAFMNYKKICKKTAGLYICHPSSYQREFQDALELAGFDLRCQIIWAKNTFAWGLGRYKFQHEPIFYAHVKGQSDPWYGDKSQATLWEENKPAANRLHPTMKPVELIVRALRNSSKLGDIVCDLFGGSGSTLIACEMTSRLCRMLELDPKYAQVIAQRHIDYTNRPEDVTIERGGKTLTWEQLNG